MMIEKHTLQEKTVNAPPSTPVVLIAANELKLTAAGDDARLEKDTSMGMAVNPEASLEQKEVQEENRKKAEEEAKEDNS